MPASCTAVHKRTPLDHPFQSFLFLAATTRQHSSWLPAAIAWCGMQFKIRGLAHQAPWPRPATTISTWPKRQYLYDYIRRAADKRRLSCHEMGYMGEGVGRWTLDRQVEAQGTVRHCRTRVDLTPWAGRHLGITIEFRLSDWPPAVPSPHLPPTRPHYDRTLYWAAVGVLVPLSAGVPTREF